MLVYIMPYVAEYELSVMLALFRIISAMVISRRLATTASIHNSWRRDQIQVAAERRLEFNFGMAKRVGNSRPNQSVEPIARASRLVLAHEARRSRCWLTIQR